MPDDYDDALYDSIDQEIQQPVPQKKLRTRFNAIIVNARQNGNPVLNGIKNVPWEYGDIDPDFVLGATSCALYLSLKYHRLHPEYIYSRISSLSRQYELRVLLVLCDIDNHIDSLRELSKTGIINGFSLFVCWSSQEAGRYLESFKSLESAGSTQIKGHISTDYADQLVDVVTSIKAINKSDAYSLIGTFGSFKRAVEASAEEIGSIGGWGPRKVRNFMSAVSEPFSRAGMSRGKQDEILSQAIQGDKVQNEFGPGENHSIERSERETNHERREEPVREVNKEYAGVLASLTKMREESGYKTSG